MTLYDEIRSVVGDLPTLAAAKLAMRPRARKGCCLVDACPRPLRACGYCYNHYRSARRNNWPNRCPVDFKPPPPPRRGRKPKVQVVATW